MIYYRGRGVFSSQRGIASSYWRDGGWRIVVAPYRLPSDEALMRDRLYLQMVTSVVTLSRQIIVAWYSRGVVTIVAIPGSDILFNGRGGGSALSVTQAALLLFGG